MDEYIRSRLDPHRDLVEAVGREDAPEARWLIKEHTVAVNRRGLWGEVLVFATRSSPVRVFRVAPIAQW